jgi:outer membrane receptor for ferrienterochelin and colicin
MLKKVIIVFILCLPLLVRAESGPETPTDLARLLAMDLATLGTIQVFTANRQLTSIEEAPSVISVITAEQIERQGLKSLHEVLARVPGFFNATSPFLEPISNRGFVQNSNVNYLLLVDGHSLNDTAIGTFPALHQMPNLDRVARIEIIRGPGSTLWGSNAGMGIIHIITHSGAELDNGENKYGTLKTSYDYEFDHQRHVVQGNYGKRFDDGGLLLSGTFYNSSPQWTTSYQAGATDFEVQTSRQMNLWDFEDSHDLYAKLNWKGWDLKVGDLKHRAFQPLNSPVDGSQTAWRTTERQWIELGNEWQFAPAWSLQSRIYYDDFSSGRFWTRVDHFWATQEVDNITQGKGAELLLHYRNDNHHLLFGVSADRKDVSRPFVQTPSNPNDKVQRTEQYPPFTDRNRAVFFEETYSGIDDWVFTVGGRFDSNEPRDTEDVFLPRVAVAHSINDRWSAKYAFNTGNVRPSAVQKRGGIQPVPNSTPTRYRRGADKSQQSQSHDLQLFYHRGHTQANVTIFYQRFSDLIQFAGFGPVSVDGFTNVTLLETNSGDMETWGLELEGETELKDNLRLYGNYAFAEAEYQERFATFQGQVILDLVNESSVATEDLTVTGTPQHIWNLGLDWDINNNFSLNAHYRGWTDAFAKNSDIPTFKQFGPEHYVDLNLRSKGTLAKDLTISAYIKNLFNNQHSLPGGVNEGQVDPQNGRQFGLRFIYQF